MDINFDVAFASEATKSAIQEETWRLGWVEVVGGINGVPTAQQFNEVCYIIDSKSNLAYKKALEASAQATKINESLNSYATTDYTDNGDSSTLAAAKSYSAPLNHTHTASDVTDFPTSLPANGGNADTLNIPFYNGIDILDFASENAEKGKLTCVRIMNSTSCPTNHGYDINDNDFCYRIFKILDNSSWLTIIGIDVRSNDIFVQSRIDDVWSGWKRINDGGNAAALENHPASDFVLKSEYDAHAANAEVHVTTGAQTFSGAKTFAGQLIPAGASDTATPQARKIYAGTTDLTAGVSTLETGAIYLVYE